MANTKKTKSTTKKKTTNKNEILKQLRNPNLSDAQRNKLMDKLYEDIEVKRTK